jgi:DNA-binding transcriptional LysR family regulator
VHRARFVADARAEAGLCAEVDRLVEVRWSSLVTGTTGALLKKVDAFDIEAAFVSEPFSASGLEALAVFEEELVLVTARSIASVTRPGDLAGATLIAFAQGCSYRRLLEQWLGKAASCRRARWSSRPTRR